MYLDTDKAKKSIQDNLLLLTHAYLSDNSSCHGPTMHKLQISLLEEMSKKILDSQEQATLDDRIFALNLTCKEMSLRCRDNFSKRYLNASKTFVDMFLELYPLKLKLGDDLEKMFTDAPVLFSQDKTMGKQKS